MSMINLEALFRPAAIAVIGASITPKSRGSIVMRNLLSGQFTGPVMPVTTEHEAVFGVLTYRDIDALPITPQMAVLCTPLTEAPELMTRLGKRGCRAVILPGAGLNSLDPAAAKELEARLLEAARPNDMRILGPGCLGLVSPGAGLNASLAPTGAASGRIAFLTQSDSLFTAVLDWARVNAIGFSHFISLGDQIDVTFASVMDYLGSDPQTRSILLYVEEVNDARRFMSASRASARNKPVLVLKPAQDERKAMGGAACLVDSTDNDAIYDAAFRRAGLVRVDGIDALFDGARTLARSRQLISDNLAILTNGRSMGLLAADACVRGGAGLASFSAETRQALAALRGGREPANPVGLPYDASAETYAEALRILIKDPGVAAVLVIHVPFADVAVESAAQAVAEVAARTKRTVLTCWMGTGAAKAAREIFGEADIPTFDTPDKAIHAFLHMVGYRRTQELLLETPDSLPADFFPDVERARGIIDDAVAVGRAQLTEAEARDVLTAYGVPVVGTRVCRNATEAVIAADELGYPVALKIRSPEISQPYEAGGVALDLASPEQVWDACAFMVARVNKNVPEAHIDGFLVQQMGRRGGSQELFIGAFVDPIFGPVIRFGHGGLAMRAIRDWAVALPPLNMTLAQELVQRTRIWRLLGGGPDCEAVADVDDLCLSLIQVSQMVIDQPQITGLEINPLFADDQGVLALGARIWVGPSKVTGPDRLAIRPYPKELEEWAELKDGRKVLLRPIRPEDAPTHLDFIRRLTPDDLRLRFFGAVRAFEFADMPRFTQIDYDREMAFVARVREKTREGSEEVTVGVVRTSTRPDNSLAEFAIIVDSSMKGQGLGSLLFDKMIRYTKARGTKVIEGQTLPENQAMVGLARKFGFEITTDLDDEVVDMKKVVN